MEPEPLPQYTAIGQVQYQFGTAPLSENQWSTDHSSWVFNPSCFQPADLPYMLDLQQSTLNGCTFGMPTQGLFQNPWAESADGAWYDAAECNLTWQDAATATKPLNEEGVEPGPGPGPGVVAENTQPAEKPYIRIVSNDRIIYQHPTAGESYGKSQTRWEAEYQKNNELQDGNPYGMWASKDEWEAVKWMATTKIPQSSINELLKTEHFQLAEYSFTNAKALFKKIERDMGGFGGPKWNAEDIVLLDARKDKVTFFYRNLQDCADFMFGRPQFAGKMAFGPEMHYDSDDVTRLYDNPWTAEDWNERQKTLPEGTTLGGILIASDATQLSTHSGDVVAHAVYISLSNIRKTSAGPGVLYKRVEAKKPAEMKRPTCGPTECSRVLHRRGPFRLA